MRVRGLSSPTQSFSGSRQEESKRLLADLRGHVPLISSCTQDVGTLRSL